MSECNKCGAAIIWPKEFKPGNRPLNPDSTLHECVKQDPEPKPSTGITPNAITAVTILAECEAFRQKFGPIESDARFESLAKIYISRMMRR